MRRLPLILFTLALSVLLLSPVQAPAADRHYSAQLSGREEVPARDSNATGHATFQLSKDGTSITFRLVVANIENVTAAHIHLGERGMNGPVVVTLYGPTAPGAGRKSGLLASGTITSADLTGDLAGHPLSDLIASMATGNTYVNVHTNDGTGDPNTRAGDFPDGEIRGQVH